jgi:hypothetical protein
MLEMSTDDELIDEIADLAKAEPQERILYIGDSLRSHIPEIRVTLPDKQAKKFLQLGGMMGYNDKFSHEGFGNGIVYRSGNSWFVKHDPALDLAEKLLPRLEAVWKNSKSVNAWYKADYCKQMLKDHKRWPKKNVA